MRITNRFSPPRSPARAGFTLIELLIVITIIAGLLALTASATMRVIGVQQERSTETIVKKVADVFDKHWKAVIAKAYEEPIPDAILPALLNRAGPASSPEEQAKRARVLYVKLRLQQQFPMRFSEINNPTLIQVPNIRLPVVPTYVKAIQGLSGNPNEECSICLLLALSQSRSGIVTNLEDFGANAINTLGNGGKGFVDSWSQPIVFCRWPVGNDEMNSSNPGKTGRQATFRDLQDPNGLLITGAWNKNGNANRDWVNTNIHRIHENNVPKAYFNVPMIWSFGPDKKPGLNLSDMSFTGAPADANDNIYSFRLRLGGS